MRSGVVEGKPVERTADSVREATPHKHGAVRFRRVHAVRHVPEPGGKKGDAGGVPFCFFSEKRLRPGAAELGFVDVVVGQRISDTGAAKQVGRTGLASIAVSDAVVHDREARSRRGKLVVLRIPLRVFRVPREGGLHSGIALNATAEELERCLGREEAGEGILVVRCETLHRRTRARLWCEFWNRPFSSKGERGGSEDDDEC